MTTLLDYNSKLSVCPKNAEESWKRTDPKTFFLPDDEVLNFLGQNALENRNKLSPWKVCFRDFKKIEDVFAPLEKIFSKEIIEKLKLESHRIVLIKTTHGLAEVYQSEELKSHFEFMSTPWEPQAISPHSPIATALASRLKSSSPHKLTLTISTRDKEIPLIIVLNDLNPQFSQSYHNFQLILKKQSSAELIFAEGGSSFSLFRHQISLEEQSHLSEFWLEDFSSDLNKTSYSERLVTLAQNAKFKDAQLFSTKNKKRICSRIQLNGFKAMSESGGAVLSKQGHFDYEPIQEHHGSQTQSNLNLKMILQEKARASFQGLIYAHKEAEKCVAKQENKNILLSEKCRADCEPRLEVYPHDITCKHGSATAEIDVKQLYYLQSRGFSEQESRNIIVKSFAQSVYSFLNEESTLSEICEGTLNHAFG